MKCLNCSKDFSHEGFPIKGAEFCTEKCYKSFWVGIRKFGNIGRTSLTHNSNRIKIPPHLLTTDPTSFEREFVLKPDNSDKQGVMNFVDRVYEKNKIYKSGNKTHINYYIQAGFDKAFKLFREKIIPFLMEWTDENE